MRHFFAIFIILFGIFCALIVQEQPADAARGKKSSGLSDKQLKEITESVDGLTRKIYTRELFSPQDGESLVSTKLTLDSQMDAGPSPAYAPIYYRLGNVYKLRGMKTEAVECYQTILENFGDTAYAPKARKELTDLGIVIKEAPPEELPF